MSFCICDDGLREQEVPVDGATGVRYARRFVDGKQPSDGIGLRAMPLFEVCYDD